MNRVTTYTLYALGLLVVALGIYFASRKYHFDAGYLDGAVFGDSSGYKRGYNEGFEKGFDFGDSLARKELALRASDKFNINILSEELGYPEEFIELTSTVKSKDVHKSGLSSKTVDILTVSITNKASFARYRNITFKVTFLNNRDKKVGEKIISADDILYPGKSKKFEILNEEFPAGTADSKLKMLDAEAVD